MVEILRKKIAIFCVLIYLQNKTNGPTGGIHYSMDKWTWQTYFLYLVPLMCQHVNKYLLLKIIKQQVFRDVNFILRPGATFFARGGIFLSVDILFLKASYGKKFKVKIVVAVGGSSWYTFLESVMSASDMFKSYSNQAINVFNKRFSRSDFAHIWKKYWLQVVSWQAYFAYLVPTRKQVLTFKNHKAASFSQIAVC